MARRQSGYLMRMLYFPAGMPLVLVVAEDWTLRVAVRAELLECGIEALGLARLDDVAEAVAQGQMPSVVVLEAGLPGADSPALAQLARSVPVIVVASHTERAPALEQAAAVLYRPVSVGEIVVRVKHLLEGQPA